MVRHHQPKSVHFTRPIQPDKPEVSDIIKLKHDRSVQAYPEINLSDGEYVILAIRRHYIGFLPLIVSSFVLMTAGLFVLANTNLIISTLGFSVEQFNIDLIALPILLFIMLVALGTYIAHYVYDHNRFYLTNESVIQENQISLFRRHHQTISLGNVEDASFEQKGFMNRLFNYGCIRLSTEGEETTYQFAYCPKPKENIDILNNAVEAFQNGRPVES